MELEKYTVTTKPTKETPVVLSADTYATIEAIKELTQAIRSLKK